MFKRNHVSAAIVTALSLCGAQAFATQTCYDLSAQAVGTSYHIGETVDISVGRVKIRHFIKDGAVFEPQNPIDQHLEITQSQLAQGTPPEGALTFVGLQVIPAQGILVKEISVKVAQQLGVTRLLPAYVEINGEVHDFKGSFNEEAGNEFGNALTGRARFLSNLVEDPAGPNGPSYWWRGTIRARATLGTIDSFTFGAQIMHFDEVCVVHSD